jgi:hypothetical protein
MPHKLPFGNVPVDFAQCIITAYKNGELADEIRTAMPIEEAILECKKQKLKERFDNVLVKNLEYEVIWRAR